MRGSRKNGERGEQVRKGKNEPAKIEPLRPQAKRETVDIPITRIKERFGDILRNLSDLIWEVDENGIFTWCSGNAEGIFGVPAGELIGKSPFDFMPAEEAQRVKNIFEEHSLRKQPIKDIETCNEDRQGKQHWLYINGIPVIDNKGLLKGYSGIYRDITTIKKAEESLRESELRFRTLADEAFDGIAIHDGQRIIEINKVFGLLWGYDTGEAAGMSIDEFFAPECRADVKRKVQSNYDKLYETVAVRKDGTRFHLEIIGKFITYKGQRVRIATVRDITERSAAEEALQESEERLKAALDAAELGIWDWDMVSGRITWAGHHERLFGFEEGRFDGRLETFEKMVHPEDREGLGAAVEKSQQEKSEYWHEYRIVRPDGTIRWMLGKGRSQYDQSGRPVRMLGTVQDITERKRAEEALKESEKRYRRFYEDAPLGYQSLDAEGCFIDVNSAWLELLGYRREEVIGRWFGDFHTRESLELFRERFPRFKAAGTVRNAECELVCKDGSRIIVSINGKISYDEHGYFKQTHCILHNVTEQKRAEEALRESENKFKTLADEAFDSIVIHDGQRIIEVNRAFGRLWGYDPKEAAGLKVDEFFAPECWEDIKRKIQSGYDRPYETVAIRKDGTRFSVEIAGKSIIYKGRTMRIVTTRDITERKNMEEALHRNEARYRFSVELTGQLIWTTDSNGEVVEDIPLWRKFTGLSYEETKGSGWTKALHPEDAEHTRQVWDKAVKDKSTYEVEYRLRRFDGVYRNFLTRGIPVFKEDGSIREWVGVNIDITERKKAEERLQEERNLLRTLIDRIPDEVYIKDKDSRMVACNKAVIEYWGVKDDNGIIGKTDFDLFDKGAAQKYFDEEKEMMRTGQSIINLERQCLVRPDRPRWVLATKVPLRDSSGNITGIVGINRDITERKKVEQKLLDYQKQLKRLASQLTLAEERERRRIAGELHDEVSQSLAFAKIKLDALRSSIAPGELMRVLEEVSSSLEKAIQDTRSLTFDLCSPILYELGFEAAVAEWLNEEVQGKHGIATEFEDDGQEKPLDDDVRVLLFRNVREVLINVIKHANAGRIKVGIRRIDGSIEVTIEDDGVGFDPIEMRTMAAKRAEFGLFSIHERLEELGGRFEIESKPGAGCKVTMSAPLKGQPRKKEK